MENQWVFVEDHDLRRNMALNSVSEKVGVESYNLTLEWSVYQHMKSAFCRHRFLFLWCIVQNVTDIDTYTHALLSLFLYHYGLIPDLSVV